MAWLRRAAASAARGTVRGAGSFLSTHVLPDEVIPSWKTRKRLASATRAVSSLAKRSKPSASRSKSSKPSKKQTTSSRTGNMARPQRGGLPTFNRNEWNRGANLRTSDSYSNSPSPRSSAVPPARVRAKVNRLTAQARDILMNPRLVGQMFWDELKHDAKKTKQQLSSRLRR